MYKNSYCVLHTSFYFYKILTVKYNLHSIDFCQYIIHKEKIKEHS